jgi:hypothetical protein
MCASIRLERIATVEFPTSASLHAVIPLALLMALREQIDWEHHG